MGAARLGPLAGLLLGAVCAAGCTTTSYVADRMEVITKELEPVRVQAMLCAPRELAETEAHLVFATDDAAMGQSIKAFIHLQKAEQRFVFIKEVVDKPECEPDRDGDTIRDSVDSCPDDPEDFDGDRDEDGCPEFDRDGDGLDDPVDKCPDDPEDKDNFEDEDGCPDPDNDKDGILDTDDKCPSDPEDKDGFEDADGCPDPDNDKDGILDTVDKCPNKAEDMDGDADEDGCPEEAGAPPPAPVEYKTIKVTKEKIELKQKVYFSSGRAKIKRRSFTMLDEIADLLRKRATMEVRIEGHTDSQGGAKYNKKLSQKRADAVRQYMIEAGVPGSRMKSMGYGEENPIESNKTKRGRAENRRVEFFITKQ